MIPYIQIGQIIINKYFKIYTYSYHIIHLFDPNALGWSQINCQPRLLRPYCISTFQIHLMDYPDQGFAKLKYSDTSTPIIWRNQSHLDLHRLRKYLTIPSSLPSLH